VNKPKPDIEETFRQLFDGHEIPVSDADWAAIQRRVQKPARRGLFWLLPGIAVLFLSFGTWIWWKNSDARSKQTLAHTHSTSAQETLSTLRRTEKAPIAALEKPQQPAELNKDADPEKRNRRRKPYRPAGQSESATETESHEYSRSGSGGNSDLLRPVTDESSESPSEFLALPVRSIQSIHTSLAVPASEKLNWQGKKPVGDLLKRITKPYLAIGSISGFHQSALQSAPVGNDWQGKSIAATNSSPGFFGGIQALYAVPVGKFHLQSGIQAGMDLTPRRTTWNYTTRIVTDSFPYRNVPGDTLFWVPVRYRDTQMQVQTEMRMRSIAIPLQWTRTISLNRKSGIVLQGGVRLERWSLVSGTTVNPQNDRTWSQQQFNGGVHGLTAPLAKTAISRWQGSGSIGVGAYRKLNKHWVLQGLWSSGTQLGRIKPAQNQVGMRQNFGYLHMQMLFTW
jgi:hypothetical protein